LREEVILLKSILETMLSGREYLLLAPTEKVTLRLSAASRLAVADVGLPQGSVVEASP
jgi:hypothetical protein